MRSILDKVARRVIRRARNYVARLDADPGREVKPDDNDVAYPWLNSVFSRLMYDGRGALRPSYTLGVLHGAHLARALGIPRVSVIEFGVAGGVGLISLERIADEVSRVLDVAIDVYGFDTGAGLPKPVDHRDLPNLYTEGGFPMDAEKLAARLRKARLVLGLIEDTIPKFLESRPAPVAFISFDLDYYSSTLHAFKVLEADTDVLLPRVHCYFDDIMGFTCSEFTGERLAISEFNTGHPARKISPIYGLKHFLPRQYLNEQWVEMLYLAHMFDHPMYERNDGLVRRAVDCRTDIRD